MFDRRLPMKGSAVKGWTLRKVPNVHDIKALRRALDYSAQTLETRSKPKKQMKEPERRRAPRFEYQAEGLGNLTQRGEGLPLDIPPGFPVIALSLSQTGASFLSNYEFKSGDIVELGFPSPGGKVKRLTLKIVRSRRAGLGAFDTGGEFADGQATKTAASDPATVGAAPAPAGDAQSVKPRAANGR
jgi:hypothetical protein